MEKMLGEGDWSVSKNPILHSTFDNTYWKNKKLGYFILPMYIHFKVEGIQ